MTTPQNALDFIDTLGVNVHVEYNDGKYASASNVIADLAYLGVNHVRDAVLNPSNQGQASYDALASAGVKFDMFFQGNSLSSTMSLVDAFASRHPGSISLIEGPNEVNNYGVSYAGLSGDAAAVAYQNALYASVKGDPHLSGVPVADLTSWPFLAGGSDYANYHFYPFNGAQPLASYGSSIGNLAGQDNGKPVVMTEGGWTTALNESYFGGVDEATQAKLLLNLYCDNAKAGVVNTYVYQLLSAYPDPGNSDSDSGFGLFHLDNTPKMAATAIHNLTSILVNGAAPSPQAGAFAFEVSGLPNRACQLDLAKNATTHDLLLWNEPAIWNSATKSEIAAAPVMASIHLDDTSDVSVFDPMQGVGAIAHYTGVHDVAVSLSDHPLVIEASTAATSVAVIHPAGSAPPLPPGALMGSDAGDVLVSGASSTAVIGMGGDDSITGSGGADTLFGNLGDDSIAGGVGADLIFGGKDEDNIFGDAGADQLFGNLGADVLHGGSGADSLYGGQGDDLLSGDAGDDVLFGDLGSDTLTGGAGADTFAFAPNSGHDVITDFTKGEDHIDVSAYLAAHDTIAITAHGANALITFSSGDTVEVDGVSANSLSVSGGWII